MPREHRALPVIELSKMLFRYSLLGGNCCGEVALGKTDVLTILCRIDDARNLQYYTKKE